MTLPPFQRFLDEHLDAVRRYLLASVGPNDAEDCLQETLLAALRAYPGLREGSSLRAWALTIAKRKAIDSHRAAGRRPLSVGEPIEVAVEDAHDERDPQLWAAVRRLPARQREAVVLRYVSDLAYEEIASVMGCSQEAARRSVFEGLRRLRSSWP